MFWVTMTDKYMSGWGQTGGKINKLIIECETIQQALQIESVANGRSEMKHVNIRTAKPRYGSRYHESRKSFDELGLIWTGVITQ